MQTFDRWNAKASIEIPSKAKKDGKMAAFYAGVINGIKQKAVQEANAQSKYALKNFAILKMSENDCHKYLINRSEVPPEAPKKKKSALFPHWCVYIAWTCVVISVMVSAFFVVLYSMQWGKERSEEWLTTLMLSTVQSIFFVQPIKVYFETKNVSRVMHYSYQKLN